MDASSNQTDNIENNQELLNDTWIKDYLIPKLIHDGKILNMTKTHQSKNINVNRSDNNESTSICCLDENIPRNDNHNQIQVISVNIKPVSIDGFMLSAPCKVEIEYSYQNDVEKSNDEGKSQQVVFDKVNLIIKKTPNIPKDVYIGCQFDFLFQNELIAYTEIIPLLSQAKKYPRFYYSERKELSAVCVLEDFSQYGWRSARQLYNLPLQHILLAVKEIAIFHGEMFALKSSNLKQFNKIASQLKEARLANGFIVDEYNTKLVTGRLRAVKAVKDKSPDKIPDEFLEMFLEYTKDPYSCFKKQYEPKEPLAIIIHGDYLRNNIAFQFNEKEQPIDVMMFDFQTMRYASPMLDLSLLLVLSASHDVRFQNFDQIFDFYYQTLTKTYCSKLNIGQDEIPSYITPDVLLRDYVFCFPSSILIAASFLPLLYTPIEKDGPVLESLELSRDTIIKETMERGGDSLDIELHHLLVEFYTLYEKFKIEFN
uniref:CSON004086 protein n=1 Tax=Culicoides sonorensis TaxID=179676 RepID=A0A336MN03_CULSO